MTCADDYLDAFCICMHKACLFFWSEASFEKITQWIIRGFWVICSVRPGLYMLWRLCWCEPLWLRHLENLSGFTVPAATENHFRWNYTDTIFCITYLSQYFFRFPPACVSVSRHGEYKCGGVAEAVGNFIRFYMKTGLLVQWEISLDTT